MRYLNFRARSSVTLLDSETGDPVCEVLCYGLPASELTSVDMSEGENMSGGSKVMRKLQARGPNEFRNVQPDLWSCGPVTDRFDSKESEVRLPGEKYDARI